MQSAGDSQSKMSHDTPRHQHQHGQQAGRTSISAARNADSDDEDGERAGRTSTPGLQ